MSKKGIVVIDGVVGCGKSTLAEILTEVYGYIPFQEPVADNPILGKFYYDRVSYSFPLQVYFLNARFRYIKEAAKMNKVVMDRSIYGDAIFAKLLRDNGDMAPELFDLYKDLLNNMLEHVQAPKLLIYLECSVDEAIRKIRERGRDYEQIVERQYWESLNNEYVEYFKDYNISPLLKINVDGMDFKNNPEHRAYILNLIEEKMGEIDSYTWEDELC